MLFTGLDEEELGFAGGTTFVLVGLVVVGAKSCWIVVSRFLSLLSISSFTSFDSGVVAEGEPGAVAVAARGEPVKE